jgi:hypothetical protein
VGFWSDRRRNFVFGLVFGLGALYGAPAVRSRVGLSTLETDLIQVGLIACALFFVLRGMRATGVNQGQVPARNPRLYVVAGVTLAVVAFAVALLIGKNP